MLHEGPASEADVMAKSYNPFYIPSLDELKSQSRQEAQAQIDAAVGALPKQGDVQGQFDKTGREFKAMDSAYQQFLQNQQVAAPALFDTGVDVQRTPATSVTDPGAAQTAQQASNVLAMQGFGFANARESAINGAAAKSNENQQRNRRQLNDALTALTQQISAEKAKFSPLYFQTLNQKKSDAMSAYQAYLNNQLQASQLGAQVSNDQAQIDISQQNANTAEQKAAAAAAAKTAATDKAAIATRVKLREKAFDLADKELAEKIKTPVDTRYNLWSVTYRVPGINGGTKTIPIEVKSDMTASDVLAQAKRENPGILSWLGASIKSSRTETKDVFKIANNYSYVYGRLKRRLKRAGYSEKQAQKYAHGRLDGLANLEGSPAWKKKAGNTGRPGGDK